MQASHKVWVDHNGDGPWPCHRCNESVPSLGGERVGHTGILRGVIHHHDRNHGNNDPVNLRVMHDRCHKAEHAGSACYNVIAAALRQRVAAATGRNELLLPSYVRLSHEYGVSVVTVTRAMYVLRDEGLLHEWPRHRGLFLSPARQKALAH